MSADILHFRTGKPIMEEDTPMIWQCHCGCTQLAMVTSRNDIASQIEPHVICFDCGETMGSGTGDFIEYEAVPAEELPIEFEPDSCA